MRQLDVFGLSASLSLSLDDASDDAPPPPSPAPLKTLSRDLGKENELRSPSQKDEEVRLMERVGDATPLQPRRINNGINTDALQLSPSPRRGRGDELALVRSDSSGLQVRPSHSLPLLCTPSQNAEGCF